MLYALHPDLARAVSAHTVTAAEAARLLPPDTALLEYSVLHTGAGNEALDRALLFVVTPDGGVRAQQLKITTTRLARLTTEVRVLPKQTHGASLCRLVFGQQAPRSAVWQLRLWVRLRASALRNHDVAERIADGLACGGARHTASTQVIDEKRIQQIRSPVRRQAR